MTTIEASVVEAQVCMIKVLTWMPATKLKLQVKRANRYQYELKDAICKSTREKEKPAAAPALTAVKPAVKPAAKTSR